MMRQRAQCSILSVWSSQLSFVMSSFSLLVAFGLVALVFGAPVAGQMSCLWEGYNFTSLAMADIQGSDGSSSNEYFLRVCGVLTTEPPCLRTSAGASACSITVNPPVETLVEAILTEESQVEWSFIEP